MSTKKTRAWVPSRPERRGAPPATLAEVLVGAQNYFAKQSGAALTRDEWRAIVGERIAGRTRVGRLYRGVLTVRVASSAWCSELSFLKSDLVSKLVRKGHDVEDLRFVVDVTEEAPKGRRPVRTFQPPAVDLPAELKARLQLVEDPNLRAAIAEAARASITDDPSRK